jgi:hypothetical protein
MIDLVGRRLSPYPQVVGGRSASGTRVRMTPFGRHEHRSAGVRTDAADSLRLMLACRFGTAALITGRLSAGPEAARLRVKHRRRRRGNPCS